MALSPYQVFVILTPTHPLAKVLNVMENCPNHSYDCLNCIICLGWPRNGPEHSNGMEQIQALPLQALGSWPVYLALLSCISVVVIA